MITHAWLICHNVQQFQMLKHLTGIYFIAATMSVLLITWLGEILPASKTHSWTLLVNAEADLYWSFDGSHTYVHYLRLTGSVICGSKSLFGSGLVVINRPSSNIPNLWKGLCWGPAGERRMIRVVCRGMRRLQLWLHVALNGNSFPAEMRRWCQYILSAQRRFTLHHIEAWVIWEECHCVGPPRKSEGREIADKFCY